MRNKRAIFLPVLLLTMLLLVMGATIVFGGVQGAIWTTDIDGRWVNGNVFYQDKTDVYLNGGSNKVGGADQLSDGWYYIKVTQPDGKLLGDSGNTKYLVQGGVFVIPKDPVTNLPIPLPGLKEDTSRPGAGACLIQLYAATKFKNTGNNGGEYKVWVSTSKDFIGGTTKTDNFKVKYQNPPTLTIVKFEDKDRNGIQDSNETPVIPHWGVTITNVDDPLKEWHQDLDGYGTGIDGTWKGILPAGTYKIVEDSKEGWTPTTPTEVIVTIIKGDTQVKFGNHKLALLGVKKFNDLNGDGIWDKDSANPDLEMNWTGTLTGITDLGEKVDKQLSFPFSEWIEPGNYVVTEDSRDGWVPTTSPAVDFRLDPLQKKYIEFGNRELATLDITKFYDANINGKLDPEEGLLPWIVHIEGTDLFGRTVNHDLNINGQYVGYIDPGEYTVTEYLPLNWFATTQKSYDFILQGGQTGVAVFGNVYLDKGGRTHGFWGNPNGEYLFVNNSQYLAAVNSLFLVNDFGDRVTPFSGYNTGNNPYTTWNQAARATNMAYMLSCQLAAMKLNTTAGFIDEEGYVRIGSDNNINTNGFIKVTDLITLTDNELRLHPYTPEGDPNRAYQQMLEVIIDQANQDNAYVYVKKTPPTPPYFN